MTKQSIKTTKEDIVNYWFFEQMIDESGLSVDAAEAYERCWRCGCEKRLERCHIIPESLGGKDPQKISRSFIMEIPNRVINTEQDWHLNK